MLDHTYINMQLDSFVIVRLFDFRVINLSVHGKIVFDVYILCPSDIIGLLSTQLWYNFQYGTTIEISVLRYTLQ